MVKQIRRFETAANKFGWPHPMKLSVNDAEKLGIVKGVLLREGKTKRDEWYLGENVLQGAGAMRNAAFRGEAFIDIDHHEQLPESYLKKYGNAIADPYPSGMVIDVQGVKASDGKYEVQAIMQIKNRAVYDLIKENKIVGNSTLDYYRTKECGTRNAESGPDAACALKGSTYVANSLMLEAVPNTDGTWISVLDETDIGTILEHTPTVARNAVHDKIAADLAELHPQLSKNGMVAADLKPYMEDGVWKGDNKPETAANFLKEQKGVDGSTATKVGAILVEHPQSFTQEQMTYLSGSDITAWALNARLENSIKAMRDEIDLMVMANPSIRANMVKEVEAMKNAVSDKGGS